MQLITPSANLYDRVINRINRAERLETIKRRLILRSSGFILSMSAFIWLAIRLWADLVNSGLAQYLSLLFSDFTLVMNNARDYVLSLAEAAPAISLALTLTTTLALMFCSAKLADCYADYKKIII